MLKEALIALVAVITSFKLHNVELETSATINDAFEYCGGILRHNACFNDCFLKDDELHGKSECKEDASMNYVNGDKITKAREEMRMKQRKNENLEGKSMKKRKWKIFEEDHNHYIDSSCLLFDAQCGASKESKIKGNILIQNSTIKLHEVEMISCKRKCLISANDKSDKEIKSSKIFVGNEMPPLHIQDCKAIFMNISLESESQFSSAFPPLFFSEQGNAKISHESFASIFLSCFSSFAVSSAPFLSSPSILLISLSHLTFFNISTSNVACSPSTTMSTQTSCFLSCCSFSSVCDVYDGGIVPSLNNPLASLTASNASFVGCCRTKNVVCEGTADNKLTPGRQNTTENGANSFIWCEWSGSRTTGEVDSYTDGISSGGAIFMYNKGNGELSVSNCLFNNCFAFSRGGGIMCLSIDSVHIENNVFNACTAQNHYGGGLYVSSVSTCARISGCEFQNCKASGLGGGLFLENFQVSGTDCILTENGEVESACVFDCSFSSCSVTNTGGGGVRCVTVPDTQFKMRSIQFISCSALREGGGLCLYPNRETAPDDKLYCFFLFFHECSCRDANNPRGRDVMYYDQNNLYLSLNNPFHECYTTNTNDKRICFAYNYSSSGSWAYQHTEKWDWLKDKTVYVSVSGNDTSPLCGSNETFPCLTAKKAFEMCEVQISLTITLMEGNHQSETTTIEIGTKKISIIGTGKDKSSIGTGTLSSTGALFSVLTGHLGLLHMKVDCNSNSSTSPSVVVVSDGCGSLSLEDVVITTSVSSGNYVMSSSVFVVPLSQLSMVGVEIKDMNVSKPLFSEPNLSSSSSSLSSLSSFALYLTATASGDSVLANVKVMNVRLTEGDGVVVAKSVKAGETFVVQNVTIEDCECKAGSGGGIKVDLKSSSMLRVGTSSSPGSEITKFNRCNCSGNGGGIMVNLENGSHDFSIVHVDFTGCKANSGGNYVFVNGKDSANWGISSSNLDVQHDNSKYNEIVGFDRSDTTMGLFPLNVFLDTYPDAAHVGKGKDGVGGYNSWFCGFDYYPCATITHAAQVRYADTNKKIELDPGYELAEAVGMADAYEWEISCATKGTAIEVKAPENFESSCLIEVLSKCSMRNIKFCIPSALSGASSSSLITSNSTILTLTDCSVICSSENSIGYCFVNVIGGKVKVEGLVIAETLIFGEHSLIEFSEGVESVVFCGCEVNNIEKRNGDGGWESGVVGAERGEGKNGIIVIESCIVKVCSCLCGRGGGMCVVVKGEGSVVVNGSCVIDKCEAKGSGENEGRGGGIMIVVESRDGSLKMESGIQSLFGVNNNARYGKDVFVDCGRGVLLESKVNRSSFVFFDSNVIPSNVLELCGSEDGREG